MKRYLGAISFAALALCVLVGVFLGLSSYTFYYAQGASYLSNDPAACVNCHIMRDEYDGWQKASHHAAATCNDCHTPHDLVGKYMTKASNGYHHSKGFTLQDFKEPIRIKRGNALALENNCLRCHTSLVQEITGHRRTNDDDLFGCVRCHQDVGHGATR